MGPVTCRIAAKRQSLTGTHVGGDRVADRLPGAAGASVWMRRNIAGSLTNTTLTQFREFRVCHENSRFSGFS